MSATEFPTSHRIQTNDIVFSQEISNIDSEIYERAIQDIFNIFGEEGVSELQSERVSKRLSSFHQSGRENNTYIYTSILGEQIEITSREFANILNNLTEFDIVLITNLKMSYGLEINNKYLDLIIHQNLKDYSTLANEFELENVPYASSLPLKRLMSDSFRRNIPRELEPQRRYLKQIRSIGNRGLDSEISQINRLIFGKLGKAIHNILKLDYESLIEFYQESRPFLEQFEGLFNIYSEFGKQRSFNRNSLSILEYDLRNARFSHQKKAILEIFAPANVFDSIQESKSTINFLDSMIRLLNINLLQIRDLINLTAHEDPYVSMSNYFSNVIYSLASISQFLEFKSEFFEQLSEFEFERVLKSDLISGQLDGIRIDENNKQITILELKTSPRLTPRKSPAKSSLKQIIRYIDLVYENYEGYDLKVWYVETSATKTESRIYLPEEIQGIYQSKRKKGNEYIEF